MKIIEILFNLLYKFGMCSLIILLEPHLSNLLRFLVRVILYTNINEIKVHIVRLFRSIIMMRYYSITACDGNKASFMCALLQIIKQYRSSHLQRSIYRISLYKQSLKEKEKFNWKVLWNKVEEYFASYTLWSNIFINKNKFSKYSWD